jgi:hypothetical protein
VLGEIALLRGERTVAEEKLEWACRSNPRAAGGFFLRAYLAFERGDSALSRQLLARADAARGEDWVPEGAVAEGSTETLMHDDATPRSRRPGGPGTEAPSDSTESLARSKGFCETSEITYLRSGMGLSAGGDRRRG